MAVTTILIAEDDHELRLGLIDLLEIEGYRVIPCADGAQALAAYQRETPDLLLLDVMMPELSGYDLCRKIRKSDNQTPIILLTAKGEEIDKVVGLELGADDYVTKPFGLHELRARITAVLRRSRNNGNNSATTLPDRFTIAGIVIDRKNYRLEQNGVVTALTPREMKLLDVFYSRPDQAIERNELLNAAWGIDYLGTTRTLDQHIAQLRKKLETDPANPKIILTVHGVGYRLGEGLI
jgi:DNA-binding response OmpR family regulator